MRPLSTVLFHAALLVAATALAGQPETLPTPQPGIGPAPMPVAQGQFDTLTQPTGNGLTDGFPQRHDESITRLEPGCVGTKSRCQAELDTIYFSLDDAREQTLVYNRLTGEAAAVVNDLQYGSEMGPRLTMGYQTSDGPIFEVGYFGIFNYQSSLDLHSFLGFLYLPRHFGESTIDYTDANRMQIQTHARINSVEANLRYAQESTPNTTVLVGLRYVRLEERFNLQSFDVVDPLVGAFSGLSQYDVQTTNALYGGQFGTTWEGQFRQLNLRGSSKLGIFSDRATQGQFLTDEDSRLVLRNTGSHRSRNVFMVDLSVSATYCLRNNVSLVAGYDLIWFDKLARATDQLDFTLNEASGSTVQFLEGALLHGPHVGFEARW